MSPRDFSLFVLICVLWALNAIVAKVVVSDMQVPPLFFGMLRSAAIAVAVAPWLLPLPRPLWRVVVVGILMGGGGFALYFVGLQTASPSAAAIVSQIGVPTATLLSVLVLGERIRWRRGLGIALTLAGVFVVMFEPGDFNLSTGLLFVVASSTGGAIGTIMMKQMEGIRPLRFQAWVGFSSTLVLLALTPALEVRQVSSAWEAGWPLLAATLYSGLVVSVFAHTQYYGLIQRYEANLVAPLTLISPLFTVGFGIWLTGDHFDLRMAFGTALALAGVFIIAVRPNVTLGRKLLFRNRTQ
jgi:drug/metabolite transporter (DMT)-like permease